MNRDEVVALVARVAALVDPTRVRLALALAMGGELCVCDLAWISGDAENLVSHHMRRLRDLGFAEARRDHRMVLYSLTCRGAALLSAFTADGSMAAPA